MTGPVVIPSENVGPRRSLPYSLLYTKDGELDFGWIILIVCVLFGILAFYKEATGAWNPSVASWAWFGSFTGLSFIAGAAIGRARLIAKSSVAGDIAKGIASALPDGMRGPTEYDLLQVRE